MTLHYTTSEPVGTSVDVPKFQRTAEQRREANERSTLAPTYVPRLLKLAARQRLTLVEMQEILGIPKQRSEEWSAAFYEACIFDRAERPGSGRGTGTPRAYEYWLVPAFGGEAAE